MDFGERIVRENVRDRMASFCCLLRAHPQAILFDLVTKLCLSGPVGFLFLAQVHTLDPEPRKLLAVCPCSFLGLCLEAGRIAVRARSPSITDVAIIGFGSWLGAVTFERFQSLRHLKSAVK